MLIRRATKEEIRHSCLRYHYAHRVPQVSAGYSVFTDSGEFCGTVCFGTGACPQIGRPYGLVQGEVCELVRVALSGGQGHGHTSEVVADALRRLHRDRPMIRLVVSYADADQGHMGTIYQATNWTYVGTVKAGELTNVLVDGERVHHRTLTKRMGPQSAARELEARGHDVRLEPTKGKRKYLMPLDMKMRKRVRKLAQPYPKAGA